MENSKKQVRCILPARKGKFMGFIKKKVTILFEKFRVKKNDDIGYALYQRFLELLTYIVLDSLLFVGFYILLLITGKDYYRSISYITGLLLVLLLYLAGKYLYYYDTKAYKVVTGTCTKVEINKLKKFMKSNCNVFMVTDEGQYYRFTTPYRGILHAEGDRLRIYTSELNEDYKKDGYIYIYNIILQEKILNSDNEKKDVKENEV